jgi:hypothetical protein
MPPKRLCFPGDMPIGDTKLGVGLKIVDDRISITQNLGAQGSMSYRIEGDNSNLAFGIQLGAMNNKTDFGKLNITNPGDPVFCNEPECTYSEFRYRCILQYR